MTNTTSSVLGSPSAAAGQLFCPLLESMREHSLNNNTGANLAVVAVLGLVSCLGILENALVLWVVGFRLRQRTVASVWVLNLALSDFLATLTLPLFTHYLHSNHSWELGGPLCSAKASVFFLNMFVSAFLLAAISLDRCLLVARPVWSQNHRSVAAAWKVCAVGWLWALLNTFPYLLFRSVVKKSDGRNLCYHHFAKFSSSPSTLVRDCEVWQAATAVSKALFAFLVPLVVIAGSYVLFGVSLRRRQMKRKRSLTPIAAGLLETGAKVKSPTSVTSPSSPNVPWSPTSLFPSAVSKQPKNSLLSQSFTKMVTCVIAAFALCWAPYHIFCLIEVAAHYWPKRLILVEVGLPIATTFAFLNPVLNPILYAFSCPNFCVRIRHSLGALFEGLVEEGGARVLGKGRRKRSSSQDMNSHDPPVSPLLTGKLPRSPRSFSPSTSCSSPAFQHGLKDANIQRQEDKVG